MYSDIWSGTAGEDEFGDPPPERVSEVQDDMAPPPCTMNTGPRMGASVATVTAGVVPSLGNRRLFLRVAWLFGLAVWGGSLESVGSIFTDDVAGDGTWVAAEVPLEMCDSRLE